MEKLFNILQQETLHDLSPSTNIVFEEDIFFMGFTPLTNIIPKLKNESSSEESLQLKARLKVLFDFKEIYSENQKRLETADNSHFINEDLNSDIKQALDDLQSTTNSETTKPEDDNDENEDDSDEGNDENDTENIVVNGDVEKALRAKSLKLCLNVKTEDKQLKHLSKLKRELEAKTHVKKMYHNKLEVRKFLKIYI